MEENSNDRVMFLLAVVVCILLVVFAILMIKARPMLEAKLSTGEYRQVLNSVKEFHEESNPLSPSIVVDTIYEIKPGTYRVNAYSGGKHLIFEVRNQDGKYIVKKLSD